MQNWILEFLYALGQLSILIQFPQKLNLICFQNLEYAPGVLRKIIYDSENGLLEGHVRFYAAEIIIALKYLHKVSLNFSSAHIRLHSAVVAYCYLSGSHHPSRH